jgi:hypothetical protein
MKSRRAGVILLSSRPIAAQFNCAETFSGDHCLCASQGQKSDLFLTTFYVKLGAYTQAEKAIQ